MRGSIEYEKKNQALIANLIEKNLEKNYLKGFNNYMSSTRLAATTRYRYLEHVLNFLSFINKDIEELTLDDYSSFLTQIEEKNQTSSYQISVYSGLKKFSKYLFVSKRTDDDPMKDIPRPSFDESEETEIKRKKGYLTKREKTKYLTTISSGIGSNYAKARQEHWKERDLLIIKLFLFTGIRCAALYKLDVESIDFENKTLITTDKGKKVRTFKLTEEILTLTERWLEKRSELLIDKNEEALFISNQRTRMDQSSISRVVNKYAQKIEGKNITPHKLRATCGSHLLSKTNNIYAVQKYLGHKSPKTTELYMRGIEDATDEIIMVAMSEI